VITAAASSSPVASAEGSLSAACFHCGLPVPAGGRWESLVLEELRQFCCGGCLAVAEEISAAGLAEYYALRTSPAATAGGREEIDERIYDRDDFQKTFVRPAGELRRISLFLDRVRCPACLWINERRLCALPGVVDAAVAYASRTARVTWDPNRLKLSAILASVREIGYRARPIDSSHRASSEREGSLRDSARLIFAGVLGMMVMNLALAAYFLGGARGGPLPLWETFGRWAALAGSAVLLAYPGQDFFAGAWRDLRNRRAGMDVPVVLGLLAAWIGSAWATARGSGPVYYDAIAMLIFFVLLSRAAESRARLSAAAALDAFAAIRPARARRVAPDGSESEVAALDLSPGDRVLVGPGEIAPADAILLEGATSFDESVVTGEPWPRPRGPGDSVAAGSRNLERAALLLVTRVGELSTLGEIQRLLERGQASRPAAADLADRLSVWIVFAVLAVSAATAAWWSFHDPSRALAATVAVLIVTCPCALALATPVGLTLAAARLARAGVLPARMAALEPLARSETAVFDKTGTLTLLSPRLAALEVAGGLDARTARSIAGALEGDSLHPIAVALRASAETAPRAAVRVEHEPGRGVSGEVDGGRWWLGSPEFASGGAPLPASIGPALEEARQDGNPAALLFDRRRSAALFTFSEEPRPGAGELLAGLRKEGIRRFVLLSGDSGGAAERLSAALGFDEARPGMTPDAKLAWVRERQRRGNGSGLLFVGDGVNDAPTLAAAAVSMSFTQAPQISRLACDFLIAGADLGAVVEARRIARRTRRLLVQNVGWAIAYNVISIPLAAAGLVPPWAAAIGMSASSLLVVGNAMRLGSSGFSGARGGERSAGAPR
jgi:Cu2+-exporting ATPase